MTTTHDGCAADEKRLVNFVAGLIRERSLCGDEGVAKLVAAWTFPPWAQLGKRVVRASRR
jgi:hypothetical protein